MAAKKAKYTCKTEDNGSVTVMVDEVTIYNFTEPLGRTLVALEKFKSAHIDSTELEDLAYLMELLAAEGQDMDHFLSLPLALFKYIANELNQFFRTDLV